MPNYNGLLKARIGTCRSGTSFDVPHELENERVGEFLKPFNTDELVDIFCMTEAVFSRYRDKLEERHELKSLYSINDYIRSDAIAPQIAKLLEMMDLVTSPNLVQHGLTLLLG